MDAMDDGRPCLMSANERYGRPDNVANERYALLYAMNSIDTLVVGRRGNADAIKVLILCK